MHSRTQVITDAVVAIAIGTGIGTTAGLWTSPPTPTRSTAVETRASTPRPSSGPPRAVTGTGGVQSQLPARKEPATIPVTGVVPAQKRPAAVEPTAPPDQHSPSTALSVVPPSASRAPLAADSEIDLNRARELAERADVKALLAVRERVAKRVQEGGEQDAAAAKRQLEQLDRYLADARALRLRLDAQDFRKGSDRR